jgi:hypothetical protein
VPTWSIAALAHEPVLPERTAEQIGVELIGFNSR